MARKDPRPERTVRSNARRFHDHTNACSNDAGVSADGRPYTDILDVGLQASGA